MKEYIITLTALAVIFLAAVLVLGYFKRRYDSDNAKLEADRAKYEAIAKAKEICEKLLAQVTLALFTEAERKFGDGTGKLKMSYVLERFLALLPDWVQELIDPVWLADKLEALLLEVKELWKENDKLLGTGENIPKFSVAMTFDEFVEYGKNHGAHIVNGVPWSFEYKGCAVTHCEDGSYLITTPENGDFTLTPNDMLITSSDGLIYPCETNLFKQLFKNVAVVA